MLDLREALFGLALLGLASGTNGVLAGPPAGKHVLAIGIDGVRADAIQAADTPHMDALIEQGAVTYDAYAGGLPSGPTNQATSSGPGWSSVCTGVWVDDHGVTDNSFSGSDFVNYPHFFARIREVVPTAYLSSIVQWHPINDQIVSGHDFVQNVADSTQAVEDAAVAHLISADPDLLFLHFDDVDHAGHSSGFSPSNPAYLSAIETVDASIGKIVTAIESRPGFPSEDWLIVITTDHGGNGTSHGGQSDQERTVWLIASGGESCVGEVEVGPGHTALPPTVAAHLGVAVDPAWGWVEGPFGLDGCISNELASDPLPANGATSESVLTALSWQAGSTALSHDVYFGSDATPDATEFRGNQLGTIFDPGDLSPATTYYWRIDEVTPVGTVVGIVWSFTTSLGIANELVLHLPFDGSPLDASGRDNHGTQVGGPVYIAGRIGQALDLDGTLQYVTLGTAPDLDFGADTDFSVSFWILSDGLSGDPSIVSNKDWVSGSNTGWVVAAQTDGLTWQWNFKGTDAARRDFENGGTIANGQWHHVVVSHDRDAGATFYHDGVPISVVDIAASGSTDSSLDVAIGQDGTLTYPADLDATIDDVGIWRRALGDSEVQELFGKGEAGLDLQSAGSLSGPGALPAGLQVDKSGVGDLLLNWPASCSPSATDYAVYEGLVGDWYGHTRRLCSDDLSDRTVELTPGTGSRYYLVVPLDETSEGSFGFATQLAVPTSRPRPPAPADRCRDLQDPNTCPQPD
ncbi:MAG: hypothetical protein GY716_15580 [bacterium]|nr:hypothetical protein [bacterium]